MIRINSRNCADFPLIFHNGAVALVPRPTTLQLWQMDQIWFQTKPSKLSHFTGNVKLVMIKRDGFLWQISWCIFYQKCKIDTHLTTQSNRSQGTRNPTMVFYFINLTFPPTTSTNTVPVLCGAGAKLCEPSSLDGPRLGRRDKQHGPAGQEASRGRLLSEDSDEA